MVQLKKYAYKSKIWRQIESTLYRHKLTESNIKRYGWASEPDVELTEENGVYTLIIWQSVSYK